MIPKAAGGTAADRVAIVTGASSGIGEACARRLARNGFRVVLAARRGERLERIAKEIAQQGGDALPVSTDLGETDATDNLVDETLAAYGRIDLLLNNAGYSPAAAIEQFSRDELRQTFDVNLLSGLHLIGRVIPVMLEQGSGRILNMGSLGGSVPAPLAIAYASTKAGIAAATRGLRLELAPWNIHVALIVPGFVRTEVFDKARAMGEALRGDPANPYRKMMFDLDDFAQANLKKALEPDDVATVVLRAATEARPRSRYYAPFSARLQASFLAALPEPWVERILRRVYKIP